MSPRFVYMLVTVAAASCLAAIPADAQERRGEGRERARVRSVERGAGQRDGRERQAVRRPAGSRQTSAAQQAPRPAGTRPAEPRRLRLEKPAVVLALTRAHSQDRGSQSTSGSDGYCTDEYPAE